jgi:hypothetical protein
MTAWQELKARGDSNDAVLSPVELAIYNLWYETSGFESDAERAAEELQYLQRVESAAQELAAQEIEADAFRAGLKLLKVLESKRNA